MEEDEIILHGGPLEDLNTERYFEKYSVSFRKKSENAFMKRYYDSARDAEVALRMELLDSGLAGLVEYRKTMKDGKTILEGVPIVVDSKLQDVYDILPPGWKDKLQ